MSLFRKVARAFVVVDDEAQGDAAPQEGVGLDEITKDTSTLLAQLDGGDAAAASVPAGTADGRAAVELTADDVFRREGISDDANAAPRLIKLVAGLAMFPREQQLTMVRAMDAADDAWSEDKVAADARRRVQVLRAHLDALGQEREQALASLSSEIQHVREGGAAVTAEIDRQIAELYQRREREAAETATAIARLEQQQTDVRQQEARARQGIAAVIQALTGLLGFLGAPQQHGDR